MRRYGEAVEGNRKYRDRPGAYGLIYRGDRLLVVYSQTPSPEVQLPGGGIDPGESPIQAIHREVLEETGWRVQAQTRFGAYQRFCELPEYGFWARKICHVYVCRAICRLGPPQEAGHVPLWVPAIDAPMILSEEGDQEFARAFSARR